MVQHETISCLASSSTIVSAIEHRGNALMTWLQTARIRTKTSRSLTQRRFRFDKEECPQQSEARIPTPLQSGLLSPKYDRQYADSSGNCLPVTRESPASSDYRAVPDRDQPIRLTSHVAQRSRLKQNLLSLFVTILWFLHMEDGNLFAFCRLKVG